MSTLDKVSVRKQVEAIKADFDRFREAGKLSVESIALMNSLLLIVELILSIFLERTTKKGKNNSSLPSSKDEKTDDADTTPGSKTKGKATNTDVSSNQRTVETVTIAPVQFCAVCGADLTDVPCSHTERRTKIDIVFEKVVEHVDAEVKTCPACKQVNKGSFPADMLGPLQYGDGIKAFVINLLISQMVALNRAAQLVQAMIGTLISEATLLQFVMRLYGALEDWEQRAKAELMNSKVMHVDETSLRVDKQNHWIHVYAAGDTTLKLLHRKRGKKAMEEFGLIPNYTGVIVHDCWASYLSYDNCKHGLCGAHLVRELSFIIDSNGYAWARNMRRLLLKTCKTIAASETKCLNDADYAQLQKHYRNLLTRGEKEMPEVLPKAEGKRGKLAKSDAHNLLERLQKYEAAVLLFAKQADVPFTNNRSERDLRMAKVKQKVSGCFRNEIYAKAYCRISSYLQTQAARGVNPLIAIQLALAGKA